MKFLLAQLLFFAQSKTARRNLSILWKFFAFLFLIICLYSILFHALMMYEGRYYSWITGFYWTMTVMSTLGFGDITFHTDLGLLFTIVVLMSGILFLLIILPFTFIQFFYAPWLEAQEKARAPNRLPEDTSGHVIITNIDPITTRLIEYLVRQDIGYYVVATDLQTAGQLIDQGYRVVIGELDHQETYRRICLDQAALVVVTNDDLVSTNIAFTIRQVSKVVPIVTNANHEHSIDILEFSGNIKVYEFMKMLGDSLSKRTFGVDQGTNVIGRFDDLLISEMPARYTLLEGRTLAEAGIRKATGVTVIGMMEKGTFKASTPQTMISPQTILMLAGSAEQLKRFNELYSVEFSHNQETSQVIILGGGRVGQVAAATLSSYKINYRIVEKRASTADGPFKDNIIVGDAADLKTLKMAGIDSARSVIITTHSDDMNIYLAFYCRQLRPDIQIISRSILERNVAKLHMAGADQVMSYASLGAGTIFQLLRPSEVSLLSEGLLVLKKTAGQQFAGKTIKNCAIREKSGFSVMAIRRNGSLLISPDPNTPIDARDELIAIGTSENEKRFQEL